MLIGQLVKRALDKPLQRMISGHSFCFCGRFILNRLDFEADFILLDLSADVCAVNGNGNDRDHSDDGDGIDVLHLNRPFF